MSSGPGTSVAKTDSKPKLEDCGFVEVGQVIGGPTLHLNVNLIAQIGRQEAREMVRHILSSFGQRKIV